MIEHTHSLAADAPDEDPRPESLQAAIDDCLPGVLTRFRGDAEERFLTRFVAESDVRDLITLTAPREEHTGKQLALRRGEHVGVTFRRAAITHVFTSVVARADRAPTSSSPETISLNWPAHVQIVHRRLHDRFAPPANKAIRVLLWSASGSAHRPRAESRQALHESAASGLLKDLSVGGMRMHTSQGTEIEVGATVTCAFNIPISGPVKYPARLRNVELHTDGTRSLGFEFTNPYVGVDGHCRAARLAAIASQFRRTITA